MTQKSRAALIPQIAEIRTEVQPLANTCQRVGTALQDISDSAPNSVDQPNLFLPGINAGDARKQLRVNAAETTREWFSPPVVERVVGAWAPSNLAHSVGGNPPQWAADFGPIYPWTATATDWITLRGNMYAVNPTREPYVSLWADILGTEHFLGQAHGPGNFSGDIDFEIHMQVCHDDQSQFYYRGLMIATLVDTAGVQPVFMRRGSGWTMPLTSSPWTLRVMIRTSDNLTILLRHMTCTTTIQAV